MVVSRLHSAQIKLVDLGLLAFILVLITGAITSSGAVVQILTLSLPILFIIVVATYLSICLFIGFVCVSINAGSWLGRITQLIVSTLLMLFLFPMVLSGVMYICQYQLIANAQEILFYGILLRVVVRAILGRYWKEQVI